MSYKEKLKKSIALFLVLAMTLVLLPVNGAVHQAAVKKAKKLTLNNSSVSLVAGGSVRLKVKKVLPAGAPKGVNWKSSDRKVATVTGKGKVKALKAGTAKITATSKTNAKVKAVCRIKVYKQTKKIQLNSAESYTLSIGDSIRLSAEVTSPAKNAAPVRWKSDHTDVASISKDGLVKAVSEGTAKMTAVSGNQRVSVTITVQKEETNPSDTETCLVTYDTGDGSKILPQSVEKGKTALKPENPSREGYAFAGWYLERTYTTEYHFSEAVTTDLTLYAKWNRICTVTFQTNGGTSVAPVTAESGKLITKPANPVRNGYSFAGWYRDKALTKAYDFSESVTEDFTLYAQWTAIYTGSVSTIGSGSSSGSGSGNNHTGNGNNGGGNSNTGNENNGSGNSNTGNENNGGGNSNTGNENNGGGNSNTGNENNGPSGGETKPDEKEPSGGEEPAPVPESYTVTFDTNGGDSLPVQMVQKGNTSIRPDNPVKKGYLFDDWYTDASCTQKYDFAAAVTQNIILYAKWTASTITLSANKSELTIGNNEKEVIFRANFQNPNASSKADTKLMLYQKGGTVSKELQDSGLAQDGDDIPGDGVYSTIMTMPEIASDYQFYVTIDGEESTTSNEVTITVYHELSAADLSSMDNTDNQIQALMDESDYQSVPEDQQIQKIGDMLEELGEQDFIKADTVYYDEENKNYSFEYSCGVYGMVVINEDAADEAVPIDTTGTSGEEQTTAAESGSYIQAPAAGNEQTQNPADSENSSQNPAQGPATGENNTQNPTENENGSQNPEAGSGVQIPENPAENESSSQSPEAGSGVQNPAESESSSQNPEAGSGMQNPAGNGNGTQNPAPVQTETENPAPAQVPSDAENNAQVLADAESTLQPSAPSEEYAERLQNAQNAGTIKPDEDAVQGSYNQKAAKVIILYSRDEPGSTNQIYQRWVKTYNKLKQRGDIDVTLDGSVTVEKYKKAFAGKDLVLVHSHGSRLMVPMGSTVQMSSLVCLRDKATAQKDNLYNDDLKRGRLVRVISGGQKYYWVCPSFFSYYYNNDNDKNDNVKIDNSIVYMGMCLGFGEGQQNTIDYTLGTELKKAGAASVLGYHNSVYTYYNLAMAESIIDELLTGKTIGEAVGHAKNTVGKNDEEWFGSHSQSHPASTLILDGNKDKVLFSGGIINGSFEDSTDIGNSNWKYEGDARILTKLAELVPQEGSQMSIITTGLGSKEAIYKKGTEGSYIYQYFKVPQGTPTLSYSYDVVSEEPMEYVNSVFDDRFAVELVDESGNVLKELTTETVNTSTWYPISGIDFQGGDHTTYHTKWKTCSEDISEYAGRNISIRFSVCDLGDSIYDTAALIDHVYLN